MEKWIFYWLAWILWVVIFFFDQGKNRRYYQSLGLLILIIFSNYYVSIYGVRILVPTFYCLLLGFFLFSFIKRRISDFFVMVSLCFCYAGLKIWEIFNPLWIFLAPSVFWVGAGTILLFLFTRKDENARISIWLISTSFGQILCGIIQISYGFPKQIGDYHYLISIVLFLLFMKCYNGFIYISNKLEKALQQVR